jgi:hypothetical protein
MSTTRRQFILGTAAGLILPSYYDKVFSYFENHGEPLIEIPKQVVEDLYAVDWGGGIIDFHLGEIANGPPEPMTLREYAKRYFCGEQGYLDEYCEEREEVDFDEIAYESMVETTWTRNNNAAQAHRLLEKLDLGSDFDSDDAVGQLEFLDCPNMCSDYLGVQTEDPVSISLLQKRLNELNTGIRISLVEADHV